MTNAPHARIMRFARSTPARLLVPTALAASVALMLALPSYSQPSLSLHTSAGQDRVVALTDGSRITIGAQSGIRASLSEAERRVELAEGQAFFDVSHDPARPFIVEAGKAEIRVTGTKFDVRYLDGEVSVAVLEGTVEVRRRPVLRILGSGRPDHVLTAGRMSELQPGHDFGPVLATKVAPGEWRTGRLSYADAPLADILADAERYSGKRLRAADREVAAMRLTASLRAGHIGSLIENIEAAVPLEARREPDGSFTFIKKGA